MTPRPAAALDPVLEELRAIRRLLERQGREMLTAQDAGQILGVKRQRVAALIRARVINGEQVGRRYRISREEVDRLARDGLPPEPKRRGRPRKPLPKSPGEAMRRVPIPEAPIATSAPAAASRGPRNDAA